MMLSPSPPDRVCPGQRSVLAVSQVTSTDQMRDGQLARTVLAYERGEVTAIEQDTPALSTVGGWDLRATQVTMTLASLRELATDPARFVAAICLQAQRSPARQRLRRRSAIPTGPGPHRAVLKRQPSAGGRPFLTSSLSARDWRG